LADGTRVHAENVSAPAKQASDASVEPAPDPVPTSALERSTPVVTGSADPDDAVISAALSAHVDSIVNDARRNVAKYPAAR
jgi:hypothetical protein